MRPKKYRYKEKPNYEYSFGVYDMATDKHAVAIAAYINGVWDYKTFWSKTTYGTFYDFTDTNSYVHFLR